MHWTHWNALDALDATMLAELPPELMQEVCARLTVVDRARLHVALPKASRLRRSPSERTLGVLTVAIKKGRVRAVSPAMRDFFARLAPGDPTRAELEAALPEVAGIAHDPDARRDLWQRLKEGTLRPADVERVMRMKETMRVVDFLAGTPPCFLRLMHGHGDQGRALVNAAVCNPMFMFGVLLCCNEDMLKHMWENGAAYGLQVPLDDVGRPQIDDSTLVPLCKIAKCRTFLFRHFHISADQVRTLYEDASARLDVDGMEFYDRL